MFLTICNKELNWTVQKQFFRFIGQRLFGVDTFLLNITVKDLFQYFSDNRAFFNT